MARAAKKRTKTTPKIGPKDPKPHLILGALFLILGLLIAIAIGDYNDTQNSVFHSTVKDTNLIGKFGVQFAYATLFVLGLAAYATPVLAFWVSYMFFRPFARHLGGRKVIPVLLIFLSLAVFGSMYQVESNGIPMGEVTLKSISDNMFPYGWGGFVGYWTYTQFLRDFFGMVGSIVVFGVLSAFSLILLLIDNLGVDIRHLFKVKFSSWAEARAANAVKRAEAKARKKEEALARKAEKAARKAESKAAAISTPAEEAVEAPAPAAVEKSAGLKLGQGANEPQPFAPIMESDEPAPARKPTIRRAKNPTPPGVTEPSPTISLPGKKSVAGKTPQQASGLRIIAEEEVRKAEVKLPEKRGNFKFPPMRLLAEPSRPTSMEDDDEVHQQTADMLVKTLEEFGVRVTTGDVHTGPVITRYDVYPAAGVRVERILSLDKNIALNLKATSVRILAPVPGKGCVGIEVPNKSPQSVYIRDILESEDWVNNKAEIPVALGKEVSGKPLIADLTKMPHLLIAGSTGSGKTVCINSVITSLLYHSSPDDLRFVMVDPKIVEMQVYNSLPHMLVPVVTDPKKVPNALKYLLNEMERRYQLFAGKGVRNIAGYNAKMAKGRKEAREAEEKAAELDAELTPEERAAAASIEVPRDPEAIEQAPEKLPYIVCIVDELADLMMVAPADIETGIARLAQLARAAGIHLILATQRPSVNVITGVIKANLPSRIAFKVASKVDSRTILDTMGADHLIGKGDMLFLPPGSADLVRAQGAFVGDDEITNIVHHIRDVNGEPQFDEQFQRNIDSPEESGAGGAEGEWDDELVPDAIEVIKTSKRASTSMLQRRLKIGYNRAARIMELLEAEGMVGPENGSSPREILMDLDL
jgi:S-DNA-T family DNA segregation ATPase FtsK/SpoIIIE